MPNLRTAYNCCLPFVLFFSISQAGLAAVFVGAASSATANANYNDLVLQSPEKFSNPGSGSSEIDQTADYHNYPYDGQAVAIGAANTTIFSNSGGFVSGYATAAANGFGYNFTALEAPPPLPYTQSTSTGQAGISVSPGNADLILTVVYAGNVVGPSSSIDMALGNFPGEKTGGRILPNSHVLSSPAGGSNITLNIEAGVNGAAAGTPNGSYAQAAAGALVFWTGDSTAPGSEPDLPIPTSTILNPDGCKYWGRSPISADDGSGQVRTIDARRRKGIVSHFADRR